ncbi:MAG: tetratricopeptide repeat protein [Acidiferrobacteraceae bacterium]|jgi:Flp pilus assembly protein TadD|nr:tetratricopeptide repeat protein [Acidiferrobacteraceae bacterium]
MKKLMGFLLISVISITLGVSVMADGGYGGKEESPELMQAGKLIKAEDFEAAIPLWTDVLKAEPKNADAHNWMGYAQRKLGNYESAKIHYESALKIDSKHRGALEYYGELHLLMNNLAAAEELLARLDKTCWFGCGEFDDLEEAIEAYKAGQ